MCFQKPVSPSQPLRYSAHPPTPHIISFLSDNLTTLTSVIKCFSKSPHPHTHPLHGGAANCQSSDCQPSMAWAHPHQSQTKGALDTYDDGPQPTSGDTLTNWQGGNCGGGRAGVGPGLANSPILPPRCPYLALRSRDGRRNCVASSTWRRSRFYPRIARRW